MWHPKINLTEFKQMPIQLPENINLRDRIIKIVDELQEKGANDASSDIFDDNTLTLAETGKLEQELDEAIFDLYELNQAERDLIRDMCEYGLDLFYNNVDSTAVKPVEANRPASNCGVLNDVPTRRDWQKGFEGYIRTFLGIWNRELGPDSEFRWHLIRPDRNIPMVAIVFSTQYKKKLLGPIKGDDTVQWNKVLKKLDSDLTPNYVPTLIRELSTFFILQSGRRSVAEPGGLQLAAKAAGVI